MRYFLNLLLVTFVINLTAAWSQDSYDFEEFNIGRLKYDGGGDWYCDPTSLSNLLAFVQKETGILTAKKEVVAEPSDQAIFNLPYLYLTGHGRIAFSKEDVKNLHQHLTSGGFLHVDDNYGLDEHFRREIKKVFPDQELQEVPYSHPIYHCHFDFPDGPPKIHLHDGKPAQGFGIFYEGRLVVYYTYEADLGDGWENPEIHKDPPEKREQALRMGTNIIVYSLRQYETGMVNTR